jgi:predicted NACHT family NTPase
MATTTAATTMPKAAQTQTTKAAQPTQSPAPPPSSRPKTTYRPGTPAQEVKNEKEWDLRTLLSIIIGTGGFLFGIYQYSRRRKNREIDIITELEIKKKYQDREKSSEESNARGKYGAVLRNNLGNIEVLGSPDIESKAVKLEDAFVSLCISETSRCEDRWNLRQPIAGLPNARHLSPEEAMKRAFRECRLLLIIGDPGSGKTTLLKYYTLNCLDSTGGNYRKFGFEKEVLPIYFPLRELEFDNNDEPVLFPDNLARWAERFLLNISAGVFLKWLREENTLVLLDGLDEISNKTQRQKACQWIEKLCNGLENARFVVTSRATGYRKLDGIELGVPHLRADIMDFSREQQTDFLEKWFRAVYLSELPPLDRESSSAEWKTRQERMADQRSQAIIDFLNQPGNQAVRELAAVPMLLQIMAILWKDRQHLPESRSELYNAALNYLLDYRDRKRNIKPVLRAEKARRVLAPVGLWMQEKLKKDEVSKVRLHEFLQSYLRKLSERPPAESFCENLRDRAGLLVDYDSFLMKEVLAWGLVFYSMSAAK